METIQKEQKWLTADGKLIPFSQVTHQHWSNIYWYHLIFQYVEGVYIPSMKNIVKLSKKEIDEKFNGKILDWMPIFSYEISWLNKLGLIRENNIYDKEGNKIGTIINDLIIECPIQKSFY